MHTNHHSEFYCHLFETCPNHFGMVQTPKSPEYTETGEIPSNIPSFICDILSTLISDLENKLNQTSHSLMHGFPSLSVAKA